MPNNIFLDTFMRTDKAKKLTIRVTLSNFSGEGWQRALQEEAHPKSCAEEQPLVTRSARHRRNKTPASPGSESKACNLVAGAVEGLLVGVLEGEGGGGAILPRLRAQVVVEAGAGGHRLRVEVRGERAILHTHEKVQSAQGSDNICAQARPRWPAEFPQWGPV